MKLRTKFQDEDFELGEVVEANIYYGGGGRVKVIAESTRGGIITCYFETLKGMNEMFEDYEEPKEDGLDNIITLVEAYSNVDSEYYPKEIIEKLKAWKRLKDKGFKFFNNKIIGEYGNVSYRLNYPVNSIEEKDLDLLFGGEE